MTSSLWLLCTLSASAVGSPAGPRPLSAGQVCEPGQFPAKWISGGPDCGSEPEIQVHAYNPDLYILRQSMCTNYEGPFLYLIFGQDKALLLDTGAGGIPVQQTVARIVDEWLAAHGQSWIELVVVHTHAHGDHIAGDAQFAGQPNTTLVAPGVASTQQFFGISDWPNEIVPYDLGGRVLDVIPIPGHEPSHIALYDRRTCLLLTGDTLYPGRLYVFGAASQGQWAVYKASIQRLVDFASVNPVSWVLGTHIEMSRRPGVDFPLGSTHHPAEHVLQLGLSHLIELDQALDSLGNQPQMQIHREFIIFPIG